MQGQRVAVAAALVLTRCQEFLKSREAMLTEKQEALIAEEMLPRTKWWGWVKIGPFTREQAIARLKAEEEDDIWCSNRWNSIQNEGLGWKHRAEKLIRAAKLVAPHNGDVWLDDDDVRLVRQFKSD